MALAAGVSAGDEENDLSFDVLFGEVFEELGRGAAAELFELLGQFAGDADVAFGVESCEGFEGPEEAVWRFEEDGGFLGIECGLKFAFALTAFDGEKASVTEGAFDETGAGDGGDDAGGAGQDGVGDLFLDGGFEEAHAGIRDSRHTGVGDYGDGGAVPELLDELCGSHGLVVLVIRDERFIDAVVLEEDPGVARVLCCDEIDGAEGIERAQGDIGEVTDGGGD